MPVDFFDVWDWWLSSIENFVILLILLFHMEDF